MEIDIELVSGAVCVERPTWLTGGKVGAWVEFLGIVRGEESAQPITALEYEAYSPMAEVQMRKIVAEISQQHPCLYIQIRHRIGIVPVGETAIAVGIAARHRAEAFALLSQFMDRLKQDVPIWKRRSLTDIHFTDLSSS
jgi:molybdopterin synthase catalytic subunit